MEKYSSLMRVKEMFALLDSKSSSIVFKDYWRYRQAVFIQFINNNRAGL